MGTIKISLDKVQYKNKPEGGDIGRISNSIASNIEYVNIDNINDFAKRIGEMGCSWCPATFTNGRRTIETFEQMQFLVLDFDNGITFEKVKARAENYYLPIIFAYETFSSVNRNRFRAVFLNDISIPDERIMKMMLKALRTIFPESDRCSEDIAHFYFGGKRLLYFDNNMPTIDIESLTMNMELYLKDTCGANNYGREIRKFANNTGLAMKSDTALDISIYHEGEDFECEDFSPNAIMYIKRKREKSSMCYKISFADDSAVSQSNTSDAKNKKHKPCQTPLKAVVSKCRLLNEFKSGALWLYHEQLFGLATNLVNIEGGRKLFFDILETHIRERPEYHSYLKKHHDFAHYFAYFSSNDYKSMRCDNYCPYRDSCRHGVNIIETVQTKRHEIIKLANSEDTFISPDLAQKQLLEAIDVSMAAPRLVDPCDHPSIDVIRADLGLGKTSNTLEKLKTCRNPCMLAFPTNKLKNEKCKDALKMGISAMATPSLNEIKDDKGMPPEVWATIHKYLEAGLYSKMKDYIQTVAKERNIQVLKDYLEKEEEYKNFRGHLFTTHNKMLHSKSFSRYKKIVDEDLMTTLISNQVNIKISEFERLLENPFVYDEVKTKIKMALEYSKTSRPLTLFKLPKIDFYNMYDNEYEDIPIPVDISSFCQATSFCCVKNVSNDEIDENSFDDSICFFKPIKFTNSKYMIMSATPNKELYEKLFGKNNIRFHDCGRVKYKGNLIQFHNGESMGRGYFKKNSDIYNIIRNVVKEFERQRNPSMSIDEIDKKVDVMPIITFKKFIYKIFGAKHWYHNVAGTNDYEGMDMIVAGTPHYPEYIYKLLAYTLGFKFDINAKIRYQEVEHNGCKFWFMTYDDEVLRNIQFWMIESELEQAVGRARLIWHDCNVYLFSDFPLRQAQLYWFR